MSVNSHTFEFRFPSDEDAEMAPHGLDAVAENIEGLEDLRDEVDGDTVLVTAAFADEFEPGVAAALENWASSSGGYAA